MGLSSGLAGDYTNLAAMVRFNAAGTIDARNGGAYTAAAAIPYSAGMSYHFILDVNLTAHTYNASVVVNGAQAIIGTNLAFRSEQAGGTITEQPCGSGHTRKPDHLQCQGISGGAFDHHTALKPGGYSRADGYVLCGGNRNSADELSVAEERDCD